MGLKRGTVELENYDSNWKVLFEKEKKLLEEILKGKILDIQHVGSTSIPGLKSKPIIDISIAVKNLEDAAEFEKLLEPYDYHFRGHQGVEDRYFYAKGAEENRTHYLHFEQPDSESYKGQILFRDYLIKHPEKLKEYQVLKESLSKEYPDERAKYTSGKSEFIKNIVRLAKKELDGYFF